MKKLLIGLTLLTSVSAFAETTDLRSAKNISCQSNGLGSFYLANLDSKDPKIVSATDKFIVINRIQKNSISFSYRDYAGYTYKIILDKVVNHEDESNNLYTKLSGVFINGHIENAIECKVD